MKSYFVFVIAILAMMYLAIYFSDENQSSGSKQHQVDSLKLRIHDLERDTLENPRHHY